MSNRRIQMPREVYIDPGIIKDTGEICKSLHLDKKILIVTGNHTFDVGAKPVMESLEKEDIESADAPLTLTTSYSISSFSRLSITGTAPTS